MLETGPATVVQDIGGTTMPISRSAQHSQGPLSKEREFLTSRQAHWAAIALLGILVIPLGTLQHMWNPNEASRTLLSVSLSVYGTSTLDETLTGYGAVPQDMSIHDGHVYSDKAPGLSLIAAPLVAPLQRVLPTHGPMKLPDYWPLRHLLTLLLVCLPTVLFVVLAARDPMLEEASPSVVAFLLLFVLATPVLTYGSVFFSHVPAGIMLGIAYLSVHRFDALGGGRRWVVACLAGLCVSYAVGTEYPTILLVAPLALLVVFDRRKRWAVAPFAVGMTAGFLPLLVYNQLTWGSLFATGYSFKATVQQATIHSQGMSGVTFPTSDRIWGVLLSPRRGLLFYCPLFACIPIGWARLWKNNRLEAIVSIVWATSYVAFAAGFVDWEGGWSAAARHLVPVLFLMLWPFSIGLRAMLEKTHTAALAGALLGWSLGATLLSIAVTPYFPELFTNPLAQIAISSLREGAAFRNLVSDHLPISTLLVFFAFFLVVVLLVTASLFAVTDRSTRRVAAIAAFGGMLLVQPLILYATSPVPTPKSELARAELLRRLGYDDLARVIARKASAEQHEEATARR
jgi:hypothetical protein